MSHRRVSEPPEEAAQGGESVAVAAPLRLRLLEAHDVVDPPIEEGAGGGESVADVVHVDELGRSVDAHQDDAFGIMVEGGRPIAGDPPHPVGGAPAEPRRERYV